MEFIKKQNMPDSEALKAYNEGYYIEALQIIHSFIENQCQSYLMLVGSVNFGANLSETWDFADTLTLHNCLKVLFILNKISKEEYEIHNKLNTLRNKVIHNIYKEPYEKNYSGISKTEYDSVFNESIEYLYFFTRKAEDLVE